MNILYITHTRNGSGARIALGNIVKGMIQKGHNVIVVTPALDGEMAKDMFQIGVIVEYAPTSLTLYPNKRNPLKWLYYFVRDQYNWHSARKIIDKLIDKYKIDIVHSNVGPMNLALSACKRHNIPHVWHLRETITDYFDTQFFPSNKRFFSLMRSEGNYNICITKQVFNYYHLHDSKDNSIVIYDGVFPKGLISPCDVQKENYFLFVGRIEPNKAPDELFEPFSEFVKTYPDYRLLLAGNFEEKSHYYNYCCQLVERYRISDKVVFLGFRNDTYDLIKKAKAVIVMSKREGFGFVSVESMLNNTLVIGRDTAGMKEQFDIGLAENGREIAYRFLSSKQLLDAMYMAVEEDNSEMIRIANDTVRRHYSLETSADEVEKFYMKIKNNTIVNGK